MLKHHVALLSQKMLLTAKRAGSGSRSTASHMARSSAPLEYRLEQMMPCVSM
jgi:hypothetical protein